ncbi:MAG: hypothetical protein II567_03785 [Candidatus Riflebacteria bacterium]|nr:hypothetical protein [Candidatus Riflebacteria bacterium]
MESFSTTIVVFWIFASLLWIANIAFIVLDENCKDYRWAWVLGATICGPIILLPYWFLGRER